jgi:hypothetical protein
VPRTPARSPARPDPTALPDPLRLPWRPPATPTADDPRTGAGWAAGLPEADPADRRLIEAQIGRDVRGSVAVAARCRYGLPVVVRTSPVLPDGTPFPTLYWLTCPAARVAVGRLEAAGWNARLSARVAADPDLAAAHAAAHASYLTQRDAIAPLEGDPGVGGLPGRVKCLHALYAHHTATGADPVGRIVSQVVDPIDCPGPCVELTAGPDPHPGVPHPHPGVPHPHPHPGVPHPHSGVPHPTPPDAGAPAREGSRPPGGALRAVHSPGSGAEVDP